MKVRLPVMVDDRLVSQYKGMPETENVEIEEEFFLAGPISRRVALLDFDEKDGVLRAGVPFLRPSGNRKLGTYDLGPTLNTNSREFNAVSVFGTILKTISLVEGPDCLGRPITWAFDAPQLLVVPRAGNWENAFYERDSHSLQFFFFQGSNSRTVFTSLARDIVAHETGHAILDGLAPDLYNALTPQSLALHEAIGDLTALLSAFSSRTLRETVLAQTNHSINVSSAFSRMAEEFGSARSNTPAPLRTLLNNFSLKKGSPDFIPDDDPHTLSQVLSGALYTMMVRIYEDRRKGGRNPFQALAVAANIFKRMIFRGLDYLPPGEISFADYARAIIASDEVSHPNDPQFRDTLAEQFVSRGIVPNAKALKSEKKPSIKALKTMNLQTLVDSDWAAYEFANKNRDILGIPEKNHFRVRPRLDSTKNLYHRDGKVEQLHELIFKVSWDEPEDNTGLKRPFPPKRQITAGTMLAVNWNTREVRALIRSDFRAGSESRTRMLKRLDQSGLIRFDQEAIGFDGQPLRSFIRVETMNGLMRARATARMLHIARPS